MSTIDQRLYDLGLALPAPVTGVAGLELPFAFINVQGDRVLISGHAAQDADGEIAGPYGQLGAELTTEEGYEAAGDIALSMLANLKEAIGDLDRVAGWTRVFGMINSAPGYSEQHVVMNGFSDLILEVFGPDVGRHARSAMGAAGMPLNFAMEIEAEVRLK